MFFELLIYPMWGKKKIKNDLRLLVKKIRLRCQVAQNGLNL